MSPNPRVVAPRDRLDRLEFSPQAESLERVIHIGAYTCPHCGAEREYSTSSLRRFQHEPQVALPPEWRARFDAARPLDRRRGESSLEFACAGCGAPVRIVFHPGQEFAMGAHTFVMAAVVEADAWPP